MLEEIVQECHTGFGDCITGYVSAYLLKKILEKYYLHKEIKLSIRWACVHCPYINSAHFFQGHINRRTRTMVNCLYFGEDGTLAFANYYKSGRMMNDIHRKTHLVMLINQYVGKCFIDKDVTREEIKNLTYEAYRYFWNSVIDQNSIPIQIRNAEQDYDNISVIYVRLGDQYLCEKKQDYQQSLVDCYKYLKYVKIEKKIALLGDIDNHVMNKTYRELYGDNNEIISLPGPVSHTCGNLSVDEWSKIFIDLYLMLYAKKVIVLSNYSNFTRIVLFLKDLKKGQQIYFLRENTLSLVSDTSTVFAKHYQF